MINNYLVIGSISFALLIAISTAIFPSIDIYFSSIFYHNYFTYKNSFFAQFFFIIIPIITWIFAILCVITILIQCFIYKQKFVHSWASYCIVAMLIGVVLIVNYFGKNHLGRPRPVHIEAFGGNKQFSAVYQPSNQCYSNCSLPSGHAAAGYSYTSLAYVLSMIYKNNKKIFNYTYLLTLLFGTLTGISRIIMGAHFLSDVATSCFIMLIVNHVLYIYWKYLNMRDNA